MNPIRYSFSDMYVSAIVGYLALDKNRILNTLNPFVIEL